MTRMVQKFTKILGLIALTGLSAVLEAQMDWSPAGPVYSAGRARNMVVDRADASGKTLYIGSTSSGVFKSTDGGSNWAPLNDQGTIRNISYMAQAMDGTIYVATGEGFLRTGQKAKALPGTGLYRLSGSTLVQVVSSSMVGTVINRIAVHPTNAQIIAISTNQGIYTSMNGGNTFDIASGIPTVYTAGSSTMSIIGQDVKFANNGILYCSAGSTIGSSTLTPPSRIYRSNDASFSGFTSITPTSSVLADLNYGRIELAIAPSNNNIIYASCANKNSSGSSASSASLKALYVSYDAGTNWALIIQGSPQLDPLSNGGTLASGDIAQVLLVSPTNPHQLFIGGFSLYVFTRTVGASGDSDQTPIGSWIQIGNYLAQNTPYYLHENIHDIKIIPGTPNKFFFVTDAGIFRSTDLESASLNLGIPPSFQPFYKGLVTGQFNSVSIERFPVGENAGSTTPGKQVTPNSGFIGGTDGNGLTYYSGTYSLVTNESSYLNGDVYNAEFSKILPNAAFATNGIGNLYRSSNVKNSPPAPVNVNTYTGTLSRIAANPVGFTNLNITAGTPFKLWEWYGQTSDSPDHVFFYNDTLPRLQASVASPSVLTTQKNFVFSASRPNKFALIDSIVVRTGTVALPQTANPGAFNTGLTINIKPADNYANTGSVTVLSGSNLKSVLGPVGTEQPTITLNNSTLTDNIDVTFANPPFADKTGSTINAGHYKVFATIFYKYKVGDTLTVVDNNISTKINSYTAVLTKPLTWRYGSGPSYTFNVVPNAAVSNPTYVVSPAADNISGNTVTVSTIGARIFTVTQYGDYTLQAKPVVYTLSVNTDTNLPGPTYTFEVNPGAIIRNVASTVTALAQTFTVIPTGATVYTITQTGSSAATTTTNIAVGASTYVLNPGSMSQGSPVFTITVAPSSTAVTTYTMDGVSSNTLLGANTTSVSTSIPAKTTHNLGTAVIPLSKNNEMVKIKTRLSARLAVALNNSGNTGNTDAIVVSRNPLALNDPLNFVRVSQSGAWTDDANGNPTTNVVTVDGKPTVIEWSKSGTELYYATDANKVYRVSHITDINDLSPASSSGKFFTDIFTYNNTGGPNSANLNPVSPYRTTLIGSFDAPVSSISINKNDDAMVLTFNKTAATSATTGLVMYATDIRTKNSTSLAWNNKATTLTVTATYCSMIEKDDDKNVFVGTENGLYYTTNIITGNWLYANDNQSGQGSELPKVQIFDIKQQVMEPWNCYNSGQIYVATNGRGVWTNSKFIKPFIVGIEENEAKVTVGNNLSLYPNPASGNVNIAFNSNGGEEATVQIMDLSGRIVKTEKLGRVEAGDVTYSVETSSVTPGIYLVNISSDSGVKRVAKLIISK